MSAMRARLGVSKAEALVLAFVTSSGPIGFVTFLRFAGGALSIFVFNASMFSLEA